ncbi:MAG TPA: DUF4112 domain-containing protein [Phycisphaerales bacterium]|nr:DUF4112 domain-containing protein [Phycisphaerales bacterium]
MATEGSKRLDPVARAAAIRRVYGLARFLDNAIQIPGTNQRVGFDALIGLIPAAGDVISTGLALYIVVEAHRLGASGSVVARMIANIALDLLVGAIPGIGDVADVFIKANQRNVALLAKTLGEEEMKTAGVEWPVGAAPSAERADGPGRKRVPNAAVQ